MKATQLTEPPQDIRTEWRRLNDAIADIEGLYRVKSANPEYIQFYVHEGGLTVDISGLLAALRRENIKI